MMHHEPRHGYAQVNNLRLHYLDWGGDGRPLILLHGFGSNAHVWTEFVTEQHLDPGRHRVIALDQRGHGDSDWADDYAIGEFVDDLRKFAKALDLHDFDVIGHSMGARHAMAFAGDEYPSLAHVVLIDLGPEMEQAGAGTLQAATAQRPVGFSTLEKAVAFIREAALPGRTESQLLSDVHASLRLNYADKWVWKADPELTWLSSRWPTREIPYIWDQLSKADVPTLIVRGSESTYLGPTVLQRMLDIMPNATAVTIDGATHSVPQTRPDEFWLVVREFLAR